MAAALVQQSTGFNSFGSTVAASLTGVAAGNLLVVSFRGGYNGATISSVNGTNNGAFTLAEGRGDTTRGLAYIYYKANSASGDETVTVTVSTDTILDMNLSEWSGVGTGAADGAVNNQNGTTGTSQSSGSLTPSAAALMISVTACSGAHGGATVASGYSTLDINGTAQSQRQYYQYKASHTGAETATWTSTNSITSNAAHAAFLESGGGGRTTKNTCPQPLGIALGTRRGMTVR